MVDSATATSASPSPAGPSGGGTAGNVYALFGRDDGKPADIVDAQTLSEIKVDWVSVAEEPRRKVRHLDGLPFRTRLDVVGPLAA